MNGKEEIKDLNKVIGGLHCTLTGSNLQLLSLGIQLYMLGRCCRTMRFQIKSGGHNILHRPQVIFRISKDFRSIHPLDRKSRPAPLDCKFSY
jgi:hypothetical protein